MLYEVITMPFGAEVLDEGGVRFRLWAPSVERVALVVRGWKEEGRVIVTAGTEEHPEEPVFANAWAEIV